MRTSLAGRVTGRGATAAGSVLVLVLAAVAAARTADSTDTPRKSPVAAAPARTTPAKPDAATLLAALLPRHVKAGDKDGQGGDTDAGAAQEAYAFVVADDGKGKSFVQVNAQPDMSEALAGHFDGARTLPDGTRVLRTKENDPDQKGGAGAVGWTVDALRPDGFRVVVTAFNSPDRGRPADRARPALTMAQLEDIALDEAWLAWR
ncbi:hypothetical protein [Streptomyces olivaceiscleroticus]|uniref:Uncharacterized protein n=1 Tax=Streptomyces olivaceiscleroticus TaxID=68245 RepID=A0ABP3JWG4_9ACTN